MCRSRPRLSDCAALREWRCRSRGIRWQQDSGRLAVLDGDGRTFDEIGARTLGEAI
jgi:hypothetical protein